MTAPRVFLSYSNRDTRDATTAQRLAAGLRASGVDVWMDRDSLAAGVEWQESLIRQVLEERTHFLVLLSGSSIIAPWVLAEIDLARQRYREDRTFRVLPLAMGQLADFPGADFIDRFQRVPHHELFADQLTEVARAVGVIDLVPAVVAELIADKTEYFVGREYVFDAIGDFVASEDRGYFTIEGDPGAGKTTILAEYVRRTGAVAHFNARGQALNTSSHFIRQLGANLAARYGVAPLAAAVDRDRHGETLSRLLIDARAEAPAGEPVLLVVDALDEVNSLGDPPGANALLLPSHVPAGVYFVLSSRRAATVLDTDSPSRIFDLGHVQSDTMVDIRQFLEQAASRDPLSRWLSERGVPVVDFVRRLAEGSEGNFMYLRYVLPELLSESQLTLERLPRGLEQYYEVHWRAMDTTGSEGHLKVWVIYLLCQLEQPATAGVLAKLLHDVEPGADAIAVQEVLLEWRQFLHREETSGAPRWSVYHNSFRDFLRRKDTVTSAGLSLPEVSGVIADVLWDRARS
ncbi:toll/interleukin-1 receptor domain-containing protein [Frankia sp. AgB1.9]|uniref:toll/interleukin-1 receptor domain-containing protein n=1 Tax=unclassified Frankia TaxID=2632575 RepID=UPI001933B926|nr:MULTISPECIES: toll/interleukin-1 receptor domain-containing protein [unclassified Frankia]MBL7488607.1 toll/interleukin-1 receptor domain-containing protein [Frankia sp. AgW1.1]MBL7551415.1 toll/interleukin-1 receptor domain-containing protein [Frankia sp. AgB1.9]MBL7622667.1 toll/interleukin-1 receptor domain-containing protein [Frankia sp. AgB1.8]